MPAAKATPARKAPAKKAPAKAAQATPAPAHPPVHHSDLVAKSQPTAVEIRIGGRIKFSNQVCYDPSFEIEDGTVTFTADLEPTWIERQLPKPTLFSRQDDPRDGEEIIHRIHSGRRDIAQ